MYMHLSRTLSASALCLEHQQRVSAVTLRNLYGCLVQLHACVHLVFDFHAAEHVFQVCIVSMQMFLLNLYSTGLYVCVKN